MAKRFLTDNCSLTIKLVCQALSLRRSSFYACQITKLKNDSLDKEIWEKITKVWEIFPGVGYRQLVARLSCGKRAIQRVLRKFRGTKATVKHPKKHRLFPNIPALIVKALVASPLKQKRGNWILKDGKNGYRKLIEPTRPYQLWAFDWKELKIPYLGITLYIFLIIDCYTKQIKGWSFSLIKDSSSAIKTSIMAVNNSKGDPLFDTKKLIVHSDNGSAYISEEYIAFWKKLGAHISLSDPGKPTQNPYIEGFISILVRFCLKQREFVSIVEAEEEISRFLNLYNRDWRHGSLGFKTPDQQLNIYRKSYLKN